MKRRTPKTVLITGASSGIGRELALEYGRRGARVAVAARRKAQLDAVCAEIGDGRAFAFECDVADAQAAWDVVGAAQKTLGGLDMVIANAGVGGTTHAARLTLDKITTMVDVNVRGAMATLAAAVPIILAQKHGQIVGVSSLAGKRALPMTAAYNASKAALSTFLETMRLDLEPSGIDVTDVQPGFVTTEMTSGAKHPMPFLWDAPKAARHIAKRLERAPGVIAFPLPLAIATSFARVVPYRLLAMFTRPMIRSG